MGRGWELAETAGMTVAQALTWRGRDSVRDSRCATLGAAGRRVSSP